jgi:hypothetical protein
VVGVRFHLIPPIYPILVEQRLESCSLKEDWDSFKVKGTSAKPIGLTPAASKLGSPHMLFADPRTPRPIFTKWGRELKPESGGSFYWPTPFLQRLEMKMGDLDVVTKGFDDASVTIMTSESRSRERRATFFSRDKSVLRRDEGLAVQRWAHNIRCYWPSSEGGKRLSFRQDGTYVNVTQCKVCTFFVPIYSTDGWILGQSYPVPQLGSIPCRSGC